MSARRTLAEAFKESAANANAVINSGSRKDSTEHQTALENAITAFTELKAAVTNAALFSANESLEDVSTAQLRFLSVDFHLAELYAEYTTPTRTQCLKRSIVCYLHFLTNLHNYGVLDKAQEQKYELLKKNPFEVQRLHATPQLRREDKIANYRLEKKLKTSLETLEKLEGDDNEYANTDEEVIRQLYLGQLQLYTIRSFENGRLLAQELEIVQLQPEPKLSEVHEDAREKQRDPREFTDRLEYKNTEILSKEGKILRPFTIVSRSELKKKVYGTGQYLPTMSVEELIEQELANGGMISGGGNDGNDESEDEDAVDHDKETYRQRAWDDFTESVAKGSGNTMNRG